MTAIARILAFVACTILSFGPFTDVIAGLEPF